MKPENIFPNLLILFLALGLILSCSQKSDKEAQLMTVEQNLAEMELKTSNVMKYIRQYNVSTNDELRLVAYFYTNNEKNADSLTMELGKKRYAVNTGQYSEKKPWVINAKSDYIKMDDQSVRTWVEEMVKLANRHNCVMDGWSTDPKQVRRLGNQ